MSSVSAVQKITLARSKRVQTVLILLCLSGDERERLIIVLKIKTSRNPSKQRVKTVLNVFKHIKGNINIERHVRSKLKLLELDISTASV